MSKRQSELAPAGELVGDELVAILQKTPEGAWDNFVILLSEIVKQGKSAYEVAVENGFTGSEPEWVLSLQGKSAYDVAVELGYTGTEAEWVLSLQGEKGDTGDKGDKGDKGDTGDTGDDAFEVAVAEGFTGTRPEWLLSLKGEKGDKGDVGDKGDRGYDAFEVAQAEGFTGTRPEWLLSLKGDTGDTGDDAFEVAQAEGFSGTRAEWLESLKGEKGDKGDKGDQGDSIKGDKGDPGVGMIMGTVLEDETELPDPADRPAGYTYVIGGHFWMQVNGEWLDLGDFKGPIGQSAYQVAVAAGFVGTIDEWLLSLRGQDGIGLRILGSLPSIGDLPAADNENGDTYIIASVMYVWDGVQWSQVAQVGPQGKSAYQVARDNGFVGTQPEWLESLKGKSAYQIAKDLGQPNTSTEAEWIASLKGVKGDTGDKGDKGDKGDTGDMGPGIKILGKLDSSDDLPVEPGVIGEGYLILGDFWGWTGAAYENLGPVQGPKGDKGDKGDQGDPGDDAYTVAVAEGFGGTRPEWLASLHGEKGDKGDAGNSAYQVALDNGFVGDQPTWLLSLKGEKGDSIKGDKGDKGDTGDAGAPFTIDGTGDTEADLPVTPAENAKWVIAGELYVYIGSAWTNTGPIIGQKGDKGDQGDPGDDAYEVAVAEGFSGTRPEWLLSLKGDKGDKGDTGDAGTPGAPFVLKGVLASTDELPTTGQANGDCYRIGDDIWSWTGTEFINAGPWRGEKGDKGDTGDKGDQGDDAYEVALAEGFSGDRAAWLLSLKGEKGDTGDTGADNYALAQSQGFVGTLPEYLESIKGAKGDQGDTGDKGDKGDTGDTGAPGAGLTPLPAVANAAALPTEGNTERDYRMTLDDGHAHIWDGAAWLDQGSLRGLEGKSALEVAQEADPLITDPAAFLAAIKGEQGEKGDKGDTGREFEIIESFETEAELPDPTTVAVDNYYLAAFKLFRVTANEGADNTYTDLGRLAEQGERGIQGEMGPGITILGKFDDPSELPGTGTLGQGYLIATHFWGWTGSAYEDLGVVQGPRGDIGPKGDKGAKGDKGDKGDTGSQGVRGSRWIIMERAPTAIDGEVNDTFFDIAGQDVYLKTSPTNWAFQGKVGGGNVYKPASDDKKYVILNGLWVELPVDDVGAGSEGVYMRVAGAWRRLNRYDLAVQATTAVLDLEVSNCWRVDATAARTLSLTNIPTGRAITVVITLKGTANITWPANINWNGNAQPTLGATITLVTLYFDGVDWIGSTGASK